MSNNTGKDVIYIDIDDEITAVIDKVRSSHERIVALVLPKRAAVFQSIVNMKLLKRSADDAKKHLVLISSEAGLLPLAGTVGLYVAKSLQSRPEIPEAPGVLSDEVEEVTAQSSALPKNKEVPLDKSRSVGEYARSAATGPLTPVMDDDVIELDNSAENELLTPAQAAKKASNKKNGKKFSIPDFNKFRIWLAAGGIALVLLIVGWYVAFVSLPKAAVTIKTDSIAVPSSQTAVLTADSTQVNIDKGQIPAVEQKTQKTQAQQVETTGQKDKGTKASGTVTASTPCTGDIPSSIPAGSGVSANSLTFITQNALVFKPESKGGKCVFTASSGVVAQQVGAQYNLDTRSDYKIAGSPGLAVAGSSMTGGTSNIVKVVSQADVDKAKQQLAAQDTTAIKQDLQKALIAKDYFALDDTFMPGQPEETLSAQIGDEAASLTVTQNSTYTMLGVKRPDLEKLIANNVADRIDQKRQRILDYGIADLVINIEKQEAKRTTVSLQTTVVAGSQLDLNAIKKQIAGKKSNQAKEIIQNNPGIKEVTVEYSPFWVSSIPKNTGKITLNVEKPRTTKNAANDE